MMNSAAIRILQRNITGLGLYTGPIDGKRSAAVDQAAFQKITARADELTEDPAGWSARRRTIAAFQLIPKDQGINVGNIDGLWGSQTEFAFESLQEIATFGAPQLFKDIVPGQGNPNNWPVDNVPSQSQMTNFYGPHGVKNGFTPPLSFVTCPWTLKLAWDPRTKTRRIGCHEKVADSLKRVLDQVFAQYGIDQIKALRLDVYGGCYNPRIKNGGSTWSTHSWACALDFDPQNNRLKWGRDKANFARPEYEPWWEIWESEGWLSLGREKNYDWMHIQAAKLR